MGILLKNEPFEHVVAIIRILSAQMRRFELEPVFDDVDQALDQILKILSSGTRRKMLGELAKEEQWINSIVKKFDEHPQAIARHLRALERVKLVETFPKGRSAKGKGRPRTYYKLDETVQRLLVCSIGVNDEVAQSFPELGFLRCQLESTTSQEELKEIMSRALTLSEIFEKGAERSRRLAIEAKKKMGKRKIHKLAVK